MGDLIILYSKHPKAMFYLLRGGSICKVWSDVSVEDLAALNKSELKSPKPQSGLLLRNLSEVPIIICVYGL